MNGGVFCLEYLIGSKKLPDRRKEKMPFPSIYARLNAQAVDRALHPAPVKSGPCNGRRCDGGARGGPKL